MFGTIRKHQRWLWTIIVILTIVSFVIFYGSGQRNSSSARQNFGTIYGRPISRDEIMAARHSAEIAERLQGRNRRPANITVATYEFLLMSEKIKEMGIVVGDDAVASFLQEQLKDPKTGAFNYDSVMPSITQQLGVTEADLIEHFRGELARKQLIQAVSAPSLLVTPREAESEFRRENETVATSGVFFTADEFKSGITLSPDKIAGFYSNRVAQYRIPERTVINYVLFGIGKYLEASKAEFNKQGAAITNHFEQVYAESGPDAFRDANDKVMTKEAAFAKYKNDTLEKIALNFARNEAVGFYASLNEKRTNAVTPELFQQLAVAKGLVVQTTAPFSASDKIPGLEDVTQLSSKVAALTKTIPYSEPLIGSTFVVVPMLKQRMPSEIQPFETIKDLVTSDYRQDEAVRAASTAAQAFHAAVTNTAGGKTFESVANSQSRTVVALPPVSAAMQTVPGLDPRIDAFALKGRVLGLNTGDVAFIRIREGAAVVKVTGRKAPEDTIVKAAINGFTSELRQQRQYQAFIEWFEGEKERSGLAKQLQKQDVGAE